MRVKRVLRRLGDFCSRSLFFGSLLLGVAVVAAAPFAQPQSQASSVTRFQLHASPLSLRRPITTGAFFDVLGTRSAAFGYEGRAVEMWVYPLKVLDDFQLAIAMDGYPRPISTAELPAAIEVRPDSTTFTFSHAAFTLRETLFAPVDEPAIVVLLEVDTTLPTTIVGRFRPSLRLMWPAGSQTPNVGWDAAAHRYELTDDTGGLAAVIGVPGGDDRSVMPYQEEPRDVPLEFVVRITPEQARQQFVPLVVTASLDGRAAARASYDRLLSRLEASYRETAAHFHDLLERTTSITTPDPRINEAYAWAVVGMDNGLAANPQLGTGLVAGFRTSGNSERPGFAWFFGRDALWTTLALTSAGADDQTRAALAFLGRYQRDDGKIPHEISQSAAFVPTWFTSLSYAWASADATPLFVVAHADRWRATGDRAFLEAQWPAIRKAYAFSAATDTDGNGLIENTGVGHGWVEGGALSPPHEELYLQGVWIEASRGFAELAEVMADPAAAEAARANAARTRQALEDVYWLADRGFYAFATAAPRNVPAVAEPGPGRERRQQRLDALRSARLIDEDTVMPAVPLWWRELDPSRADLQIDRLGSGAIATDWGHRLLSNRSALYDPLSYHYGSVWPLFTGWASMAAYRNGRSHVGEQALFANALLTTTGALGRVTELLSGDFDAPFGRSSHHQVWSEAMVVTPIVRGLLGIEATGGGRMLRIAPQLPADWPRAEARRVRVGSASLDVTITRGAGAMTVRVARRDGDRTPALRIAPALPLDATIADVRVDGSATSPTIVRAGDVQFVEVAVDRPGAATTAVFRHSGGSDVYIRQSPAMIGARNEGLRILRSRADRQALHVLVEGRGSRAYEMFLRTSRRVASVTGAELRPAAASGDPALRVSFDGPGDDYARREIVVTFAPLSQRGRGDEPSRMLTTRRAAVSRNTSIAPLGHRTSIRSARSFAPRPKCSRRSSCE
jgi:glycogen debranching enzyme